VLRKNEKKEEIARLSASAAGGGLVLLQEERYLGGEKGEKTSNPRSCKEIETLLLLERGGEKEPMNREIGDGKEKSRSAFSRKKRLAFLGKKGEKAKGIRGGARLKKKHLS